MLPKIYGFHLRGAGLPIDYLCAQHDFHVFLVARCLCCALEFGQFIGFGEEFPCGDRAAAANSGDDDGQVPRIWVGEPGHNRIVAIAVDGHLHGPVDRPGGARRGCTIHNLVLGHVGVVGKVKAQGFGEPQGPGVIEGSDKDRRSIAQIFQAGRLIPLDWRIPPTLTMA
jgi:hypothetical protein